MFKKSILVLFTLTVVLFIGVTGEIGAAGEDGFTLNVTYKEVNGYTEWLEGAEKEFEALYPNVNVKLSCLLSTEGDYNTKTSLMLQTDNSVDVMVVDSFLVPSLVAPGTLSSLPVSDWKDWNEQYPKNVKKGMTINGEVYAVPYTTDTRGLYYNTKIFKDAGLIVPWRPESWAEVLDTVEKLHQAGIAYPIWMNGSKAQGEGTTMQTFEMLMAGTDDWIYENGKWVVKAKGLTDTLKFIQSLHDMEIYNNNELGTMLDANSWQTLNVKMPESKEIGIVLDGSWKGGDWIKALPNTHADLIKVTPLPNKKGNGYASMSGGWTLAVSTLSRHKEAAFNFIKVATNKENILYFTTKGGDMSVRKDVVSDERYKSKNVYRAEMSNYTEFTKFRPGVDLYPSVSIEIQSAVEAVIVGQMTAEEAAQKYAKNVKEIVGKGNWIEK